MLILFIDDNPSDFELARIALKGIPDLEFVYVEDFENFKKQYSPDKFAIIISDYNLSGELGTDIFQFVKKTEPDIPFIIISGALGEARAVEILKLGVTDYVLKDNIEKLPLTLLRALKEAEIKNSEKLSQQKLKLSEEKYRSVVEDQTEYIVRWKPSGEIVFANKSFIEFNQLTEEDVYDKNYYTLVPEKEAIRFKNKIDSLSKNNTSRTDIHQAHHPIHGDYWQEWTDRIFFDEQGKVVEFQSVGRDITNQKLAEIEVEKSEEKYRLLVENMSEGLMHVDLECTILFTNQRFSEMTGYSKAELIGKKPAELLLNTEGRKFLNAINEKRKLGEASSYEIEIITKSGTKTWMLINGAPLRNSEGKIIGSIGNHTDITEIKKHKNFLQLINESNSFQTGASYFSDLTNYCCNFLKVKFAFVGYFDQDLDSVEIFSFCINKQEQDNFIYNLKDTPCNNVINKKICSYPKNIQSLFPKDEDLKKMGIESYIGIPLFDGNNYPLGIIVLMDNKPMEDIEEKENILSLISLRTANELSRNISEKKLIESEEKFRKIVETIEDVYYQADMNGICTMISPSVFSLLGYYPTEVIGKELKSFYENPDLQEGFVSEITEAGRVNNLENTLISKDKKKVYISANINLRYDRQGNAIGLQGMIHNITEKKKLELERENLLKELSDKYNEAMQFNYIVSHNLRAPIANIIGLSNILNTPGFDEGEKPLIIKHITDATFKMDELVKDLNEVLSLRSPLNSKKEKITIIDIITSISNTLKTQIKESGCVFKIDIEDNAQEVFSVKSYFESILYNLINNAIKYKSELRKPEITISSKKSNDAILISISDNGIGIDIEKYREYIFGLYKRFNFDVEGKGLGLHMTKIQVEAMGGTISIQSELEKGTTFTVTFNNQEVNNLSSKYKTFT